MILLKCIFQKEKSTNFLNYSEKKWKVIKIMLQIQDAGYFPNSDIQYQEDIDHEFIRNSLCQTGVIFAGNYGSRLGGDDSFANTTMKVMIQAAWNGAKGVIVNLFQIRSKLTLNNDFFDKDKLKYTKGGSLSLGELKNLYRERLLIISQVTTKIGMKHPLIYSAGIVPKDQLKDIVTGSKDFVTSSKTITMKYINSVPIVFGYHPAAIGKSHGDSNVRRKFKWTALLCNTITNVGTDNCALFKNKIKQVISSIDDVDRQKVSCYKLFINIIEHFKTDSIQR